MFSIIYLLRLFLFREFINKIFKQNFYINIIVLRK